MNTQHELETAWKLFNLLEELSTILFDRYDKYLIDRHLDEETLRYLQEHGLNSHIKQPK
jgi:hypothetical protein